MGDVVDERGAGWIRDRIPTAACPGDVRRAATRSTTVVQPNLPTFPPTAHSTYQAYMCCHECVDPYKSPQVRWHVGVHGGGRVTGVGSDEGERRESRARPLRAVGGREVVKRTITRRHVMGVVSSRQACETEWHNSTIQTVHRVARLRNELPCYIRVVSGVSPYPSERTGLAPTCTPCRCQYSVVRAKR